MTKTYYIDIEGGISDRDVMAIRRMAIDYLWMHPKEKDVTVFSSPTKKVVVGTVTYTASRPLFLWTSDNGRSSTLLRDGKIYRRRSAPITSIPHPFSKSWG